MQRRRDVRLDLLAELSILAAVVHVGLAGMLGETFRDGQRCWLPGQRN